MKSEVTFVSKTITPGEQIVSFISAQRGGYAEQVARAIATMQPLDPNEAGLGKRFGSFQRQGDGSEVSRGIITFRRPLTDVDGDPERACVRRGLAIIIGRHDSDGLFLKDDPAVLWYSPVASHNVVTIGDLSKREGEQQVKDEGRISLRVQKVAHDLVMAWVVKGRNWKDRYGQIFPEPYGTMPQPGSGRKRRPYRMPLCHRDRYSGLWR